MRLWSISFKYLDSKGLVAVWREALLAKKVLEGRTKGYKNHPQLRRFKFSSDPEAAINSYLEYVYKESQSRKYNFDAKKIGKKRFRIHIPVRKGQVEYEFKHLLKKIERRDPKRFEMIKKTKEIKIVPMFKIVSGGVEPWEKI